MKDDLISRKAAIEALNMNGCCGMGITYLMDCDSVPAVPLDKLCEWLSVIDPCIICKESPGPQCNAEREGCWERVLTKWMEEQDAVD